MSSLLNRIKVRIKATENPFIIAIAKHSPKYLGASVFSGVVALVMTKYYTHVFDPAVYGTLALYTTLFQYMQNFIGFSVDTSAQRVYFDYEGEERREFLGTTLLFITASAVFWIVVSAAFAPLAVRFMGGSIWMYATTVALTTVYMFTNFFIRMAYNEHRSTLIARRGVLQTVMNHVASVFLIAVAKLGILGYQLGSVFSYLVTGLAYRRNLAAEGQLKVKWKFRTDIMKRLGHFAVPAFFTTVIGASLSYLDRVFLQAFHGATQVGIYSLGATIGAGMSLVIEAVALAVFPSLMRELDADYDVNINKLKRFDLWFWLGLLGTATVIYLARYPIVVLLSNKSYALAAEILPIVVLTLVLGGMYKVVSGVLSYHGIVRFYPALTVVSFGTTAILDWLLIPRYNELGAALATFLGFLVYSFVIHFIARKYYFKVSRMIAVYGTILVMGLFMFWRALPAFR